jgi:serine/threonine protein kinase
MEQTIGQPALRQWIEGSLARQENVLAVSNQGTLLHYRDGGLDLVIKAAMGSGLVRRLRERTLLREYQAYRRMEGLDGVPKCYGLVAGHYLVLEFVHGVPYREAQWTDRDRWFRELLAVLRSIHDRGVSHGDLKSKANIVVTADEKPCVIDFWLFEHGRRMDINAYVKHKYHGRYEDISGEDLGLLDYSRIEYLVRRLSGRRTDVIPREK